MSRVAGAAVLAGGVALSAALHLGVLTGLSEQRGRPMIERGGEMLDHRTCMLHCVPVELAYLQAYGSATVQCQPAGPKRLRDCRWLTESGAGWGDAAVKDIEDGDWFYDPPKRRGDPVIVKVDLCEGACPIYD